MADMETEIRKSPFVIGRKRDLADFVIENNTAVSRKHAEIMSKDRNWYIRDLDSKNKTYLNDHKMNPFESVRLKNGDRILIADRNFVFKTKEK